MEMGRDGPQLGFVFGAGGIVVAKRQARSCCKNVVMRSMPPDGPGSTSKKRRMWQEKRLKKEIEQREIEQPELDVFQDSPLEGNDDAARQKFFYLQALKEERKGKVQRAMALLEKCLAIDPADTFSWMAMARVAKEINPLTVLDVFEKAISACPASVHLHHAYGVYLYRIKQLDEARNMFDKAYQIEPGNCYVCQSWGILEQECGKNGRARELFQKAVTDNPNTDVCVALAKLDAEEGDVEQSRQRFEQAISLAENPNKESDAFRAWGMVEEKFGFLEKAERMLQKSFRARPNEETIVVLSKVKMRNGDVPGALRLIRSIERPKKQWPSVAAMNVWAGLEAKAGNFEDALRVIQLAISRYEDDAGLYLTWGSLEEKRGNVDIAVEKYSMSIDVAPNGPAYVALAVSEEKRGNLSSAREALTKAIEANPKHASAYNALGLLEMRSGNIVNAEMIFEKGLAQCPNSASVIHGAALLDLQLDRKDEARQKLERGVRLTREDTAWLWHTLGTLEFHAGRASRAKELFVEAVRRYPQNSQLLVGYALCVAATLPKHPEQDKQIRTLFKKAAEVDKYHAHAWQCWGVFEFRQGNSQLAAKLFKNGLTYSRDHGALWQSWGVLETHNGNIFSARSIFEKGNSLCPDHVHLLQAWACLEVRARNIQRARELLSQALNVDETSGACYCALALLEARHGNIDTSRQVFSKGITMAPRHVPLYRTFAEVEVRQRNYQRARELFEKGIEIDPTYAPLMHSYAELEGLLGNLEGLSQLQKRMAALFELGTEDETVDPDSSRARYIRMEEALSDYEPRTFMESSIIIEEEKTREEEELQKKRAELAANFRSNPSFSSLEGSSDDDFDDDDEEDEWDEDDDEDYDEDDWEESDVDLVEADDKSNVTRGYATEEGDYVDFDDVS